MTTGSSGSLHHRQPEPLASTLLFVNDPATTEIYTLSLHDALPISVRPGRAPAAPAAGRRRRRRPGPGVARCSRDRKSTRLNSSHVKISYAVFCLKKKKKRTRPDDDPERTTRALPDEDPRLPDAAVQ